jgi:putative hydrolase of the HAD superfamily
MLVRDRGKRFGAIQAAVFDLDGTLLDRRRSFDGFVRNQWIRFSDLLNGVAEDEYAQSLVELDGDGYAPRQNLFTTMVAKFGLPGHLADTLLGDYRAGFPSACLLFPDAAHTLATIRASGPKLGLITNGSVRMQQRKVECLNLAPLFDEILISDAEGVAKPDRQIFQRAVDRLNASPARTVFVGDHPEVDVAGARAAGLRTIWRRDPKVTRVIEADALIDDLGELVALLGIRASATNGDSQ